MGYYNQTNQANETFTYCYADGPNIFFVEVEVLLVGFTTCMNCGSPIWTVVAAEVVPYEAYEAYMASAESYPYSSSKRQRTS